MWNLAFFLTLSYRGAAFKVYYIIRSFVTYNGIFMGHGYQLGDGSIWEYSFCEWESFKRWSDNVRDK